MKNKLLVATLLLVLSGCSAIPSVEKESVDGKVSLTFDSSDDHGVMYLYRSRGSHFGLFTLDIDIGDNSIATSPRCFVRIEAEPGSYFVEADHPDIFGFEDEMTWQAIAGQVDFFEYKPIARFIVPGATKIIPKSRDEAVAAIEGQQLCISPIQKVALEAE